ncbi:ABC-2 transporter permease [Kineothrix sedimenti]|uniref:ABC-2 transporter permease n=1 Tax=Kineothrix sedimenti TaxID=3123317 RepID=A0ABZ3ESQ1_9FIRM
MKGLLLKDFYMIWKQAKIMLILVIAYIIIGVISDNSFWTVFAVIFMAMLPITALGLDERSNWTNYAAMLPFSRQDIVISKYVFGLAGVGLTVILYTVLTTVTSIVKREDIQIDPVLRMIIPLLSISFIFIGTNLPIMFKVGVEKGRLWYMLSLMVIMGGSTFVISLLNGEIGLSTVLGFLQIDTQMDQLTQSTVILALCTILLLGSMKLAINAFEKRDL